MFQKGKPGTCKAGLFGNICALRLLVELRNLNCFDDTWESENGWNPFEVFLSFEMIIFPKPVLLISIYDFAWYKCGLCCEYLVRNYTPLPDQIQLKVFVTDRVKLPTSFIPKKDRLWLKTKKNQRAFVEKSLFLCFFSPIFTRPHWDKRSYGPDVALKGPK